MGAPKYPVVFLDLDGTVFDFDTAQATALRLTLEAYGLSANEEVTVATYEQINHDVWAAFERGEIDQSVIRAERFRRLLDVLGVEADPEPMGEHYLGALGQQGCLLEGAFDVVQALAKRVCLIALTNGIPDVQHPRIECSGLAPFFTARIISGEVGVAKPQAGIFDAAMAAAGSTSRDEVLMVGDSLTSDIRGALDYGIDACWMDAVGRGRREEDASADVHHVIRRIDELVAIVD